MANQSKFEAMLEKLIAEDKAGAEELFHEIVVEKSRSIYEGLIEDDVKDVEVDEASKSEDEKVDEKEAKADDEAVDEASKEDADDKVEEKADAKDEDKVEEKAEEKDEDKVEEASDDSDAKDEKANEDFEEVITPEGDDDMGGDAADDMIADIEDDCLLGGQAAHLFQSVPCSQGLARPHTLTHTHTPPTARRHAIGCLSGTVPSVGPACPLQIRRESGVELVPMNP